MYEKIVVTDCGKIVTEWIEIDDECSIYKFQFRITLLRLQITLL